MYSGTKIYATELLGVESSVLYFVHMALYIYH